MAWRIEFSEGAKKALSKLDKHVASRIVNFLKERVSQLSDPRSIGEALSGSRLGEFWKYRVGDFRIVCSIQDNAVVIYVIKLGHRRDVYKG